MPVQLHAAARDAYVPAPDLARFGAALRAQGTPFEPYTYPAEHGFFAFDRQPVFVAEAAALAWRRTVDFLGRYAGRPLAPRPSAPPAPASVAPPAGSARPGGGADHGADRGAGHWLLHQM